MLRTTLRQFEVFVAVARLGTVTQAASTIGLTQSAASMALAELENHLGTRLFDRIGKRLSLNEDGRALFPQAMEMIERARTLEGYFQSGTRIADLSLGASSTIGNYLLPQWIGQFVDQHPGSRFRLHVSNTQKIIEAVRQFEVDMGLVEGPCVDPDIEAIVFREDELAICAAPHHPLAHNHSLTRDTLLRADWILRERGSGTREVVEQMLTRQLGDIHLAMEIGGTEAIKRAVESGLGISCLPVLALAEAVERGKLVRLSTPFLRLTRPFHLLLHRQKFQSAGMAAFLSFIRASCAIT